MRRRLQSTLFVVLVFATLGIVNAQALYFCAEQAIFVKRPNVQSGQGVTTENVARTVTLDPMCDPNFRHSERHSTAHMGSSVHPTRSWAEVGWGYDQTGLHGFYETGNDGQVIGSPFSGPIASQWSRYKVYHTTGNNWAYFFDVNLSGNYVQVGTGLSDFAGGVPKGETGVTGLGVSGYDDHSDLHYRSSAGVWYVWTAQQLDPVGSGIVNYHYHLDTGSEYEILHD